MINKVAQYIKKHWVWLIVNLGAFTPLALLVWDFFTGGLGVNPITEITHRTGYAALVTLVLSLAVTPLVTMTGIRKLATVRKSLGLHGFMYVSLHLLIFVGLDYGFNLQFILQDSLLEKNYVLVGFAVFLLLLPLAITSTKGWMKRLGRNWKRLHQLVYLAVPLAVLHFVWVRKIPTEPLVYALVVALLLLARVPVIRKRLNSLRQLFESKKEPKTAPMNA